MKEIVYRDIITNQIIHIGEDYPCVILDDSKEKITYTCKEEEVIINDDGSKIVSTDYATLRRLEYPPIQEQLDMQYKDIINGTTIWIDKIAEIKAKYPKSS